MRLLEDSGKLTAWGKFVAALVMIIVMVVIVGATTTELDVSVLAIGLIAGALLMTLVEGAG